MPCVRASLRGILLPESAIATGVFSDVTNTRTHIGRLTTPRRLRPHGVATRTKRADHREHPPSRYGYRFHRSPDRGVDRAHHGADPAPARAPAGSSLPPWPTEAGRPPPPAACLPPEDRHRALPRRDRAPWPAPVAFEQTVARHRSFVGDPSRPPGTVDVQGRPGPFWSWAFCVRQ